MDTSEGILLIDKPVGITSFDVVRRLRKEFGEQKMGHAGTLDPLASGLMLVGVGDGTKKLTKLTLLPKEYLAEILVGERRTTGDMEGKIVESKKVESLNEERVRSVLHGMVGVLRLPVSAYSAMKKGGVPMYKRARAAANRGEVVTDVPYRDMEVMEAELLSIQNLSINRKGRMVVSVRFFVGSGTYIRSLAEEFGKRMGYPATLLSLRRTKVGEFDIKDALKV